MVRSVVSKVMWVGRATVFLVGLAVILALLFGAASMALAKNGDPWILGKFNVATAVTSLGGKQGVNGPMLKIANHNAGANDTALDLRVQAGEPPLRVNRATRVARLNADKLDGKDSGAYLPGDLPPGKTVYGGFFAHGYATAGLQQFPDMVSFGYRIPSGLSVSNMHYIERGDPVPAGCSGDSRNPGADPGHLCFFETRSLNVGDYNYGFTGHNGSNAIVWAISSGPGQVEMHGVWAVTAPTG